MNALVLFAKDPQPGKVKTRFQPHLTPQESALLSKSFLLDLLIVCQQVAGVERYLGCAPTVRSPLFAQIARKESLTLLEQKGRTLGERMKNMVGFFLSKGYEKVVIIGSDTPTLPPEYVREALTKLDRCRLVLGPSYDGGYYLLGVSGKVPEIFAGIPWGSPHVLGMTMKKVKREKISFFLLPLWYDIDAFEDLALLEEHCQVLDDQGRKRPFHTERALRLMSKRRQVGLSG